MAAVAALTEGKIERNGMGNGKYFHSVATEKPKTHITSGPCGGGLQRRKGTGGKHFHGDACAFNWKANGHPGGAPLPPIAQELTAA